MCLGASLLALVSSLAAAQGEKAEVPPKAAPARPGRAVTAAKLLGGAALGLLVHESGHVTLNLALDADPALKAVDFHGIPFFAITPQRLGSPRGRYAIASAGFWAQHGVTEWLLTRSPDLRTMRAPTAKGLLAFHVGSSLAYAVAAWTHDGPAERDTRSMAESRRIEERWMAVAILAPAALDAYRYYRPRRRWAIWTSRAFKLSLVLLVLR
jgi:hypothetical protein